MTTELEKKLKYEAYKSVKAEKEAAEGKQKKLAQEEAKKKALVEKLESEHQKKLQDEKAKEQEMLEAQDEIVNDRLLHAAQVVEQMKIEKAREKSLEILALDVKAAQTSEHRMNQIASLEEKMFFESLSLEEKEKWLADHGILKTPSLTEKQMDVPEPENRSASKGCFSWCCL